MALTETLVRGERRKVPTREHLALAQLVRAEDVRVPAPAAPAEPPCSMSESLAHGLVNRLTAESRDDDLVACLSAGMPALPIKPAAAFRAGCRWLEATIPAGLLIGRVHIGEARGKNKDSAYGILHWSPREDARSLVASLILLEVRKLRVTATDLVDVTGHALMRLFYRLKTTDSAVVLAELSAAVLTFDHWAAVLDRFLVGCSVLVPTPTGVLAVATNRIPGSTSAGFVGAYLDLAFAPPRQRCAPRRSQAGICRTRDRRQHLAVPASDASQGRRDARANAGNGRRAAQPRPASAASFRPSASSRMAFPLGVVAHFCKK